MTRHILLALTVAIALAGCGSDRGPAGTPKDVATRTYELHAVQFDPAGPQPVEGSIALVRQLDEPWNTAKAFGDGNEFDIPRAEVQLEAVYIPCDGPCPSRSALAAKLEQQAFAREQVGCRLDVAMNAPVQDLYLLVDTRDPAACRLATTPLDAAPTA